MKSIALIVAATAESEANTCQCSVCPAKNAKVAVVELKGLEKNEAIAKALKNEEVKKLMRQLKDEGFNQESVKAYTVSLRAKDGSTSEVLVVEMTFKSDKGETKSLMYAHNPRTGQSVVALGLWSCAVCAAAIVGGGIGCSGVCIVGGVLTLGAACIACILSAATVALCPCYDCCCTTTGNSACCNTYANLCT